MHPVRTTLTTTANPLVLVVLVWALLWGFGATQLTAPAGPGSASDAGASLGGVQAEAVWQSSWSERFPGCVALALWPRDETPVALVTRGPDGDVARVAAAAQQPGRVVGACR